MLATVLKPWGSSDTTVSFDGLVGYDDRLTRGRCRVRSSVEVPFEAGPRIVLLWRSWQRFGLMSRWSRVRAPAGAVLSEPRFNATWDCEW